MNEESGTVVFDIGSLMTRVGFHFQTEPEEIILSLVAIPRTRINVGMSDGQKSVYFGNEANRHRAVCKVTAPMDNGMVVDWERLTQLIEYGYVMANVNDSSLHPVIMVDSPNTPREHRVKLAELFFERFRVPGLYFASAPVIGLFSTGHTTGMVFESGESHTLAVAVLDGIALPHGTRKNEICGSNVTHYLTALLSSSAQSLNSARESVREMKEKFSFVSSDIQAESAKCKASPSGYTQIFTLPDGQYIELAQQCFECTEPLFAPERQYGTNHNYEGFSHTIYNALQSVSPDLHAQLRSHTVLVGGNTTIRGFAQRMQDELDGFVVNGQKPQRKGCTRNWRGAATLGSLNSMKDLLWTKADCEENGYEIVCANMLMEGNMSFT